MQTYDLAIIGAGPGGYHGAIRAAQLGMKVALIERGEVGGTCLNRGCVPTKALLQVGELYAAAREDFAGLGLHAQQLRYDAVEIYARKDAVVAQLRGGIEQLLVANGVTLLRGHGQLVQPRVVSVQGVGEVSATRVLIAAGSVPALPPIAGADLPCVKTSDHLLAEAVIPERILIIGAGVIGVEFASFYAAMGCEVTMVESMARALPQCSRELGQSVAMMLKKRGVVMHVGANVTRIEQEGVGALCHIDAKGKALCVQGDAVLMATGRRPMLAGLFAQGATPSLDGPFVKVDESFATDVAGLYAIGDVVRGPQLAHAASAQAQAAVERMAGHSSSVRLDLIPSCIYTDPEIACVGMDEEAANEQGRAVRAYKYPMTHNCRVLIGGGARSYAKLIVDAQSGALIGAELLCPRASDMIAQMALAIAQGLGPEAIADIVHPHPTYAESLGEAGALFSGRAIHAMPSATQK